jgi:hypothetical protein
MKVHELQQFLGNIVPFARAAGASDKVVTELSRTLQCLEPFKEKTIAEFNDFLAKADEYHRTGKLTAAAPKRGSRAPKAPALSVDEAVKIFTDLETRATEPTMTFPEIDARFQPIEKLTVTALKQLAAKVGVTLAAKTKPAVLSQLKSRITEAKASFERTQQYRFGASGAGN